MTLFLQRVCTTFPSFAVSEFERLALRHLHRGDLDLALVVLSRPAGQRITFLRIHLSLRVRGMQFSYTEAQGLFSSATLIQVPPQGIYEMLLFCFQHNPIRSSFLRRSLNVSLALRHLHRGDLDLALVVLSRPAGQRITFLRIHLSLRVRGMQFSYTEAQGLFSSATLIQVPPQGIYEMLLFCFQHTFAACLAVRLFQRSVEQH